MWYPPTLLSISNKYKAPFISLISQTILIYKLRFLPIWFTSLQPDRHKFFSYVIWYQFSLCATKIGKHFCEIIKPRFSVEFCTAVALVVTGVTLIYMPFGRVTWARRAQAARGSGGMLPREIFYLRCSEMLFPSFWGHIFSLSPNKFKYIL